MGAKTAEAASRLSLTGPRVFEALVTRRVAPRVLKSRRVFDSWLSILLSNRLERAEILRASRRRASALARAFV